MKFEINHVLRAAGKGNMTLVQEFLAAGADPNTANSVGATALMAACGSWRIEIAEFLLKAGAQVNARTHDGRTALHSAVGATPSLPEQQRDCVLMLLQHGAEIDPQDVSGITPLMNAAWFGCSLAVIELLKAGASIHLQDCKGRTAREMAVAKNQHAALLAFETNAR